jgi:hypothetical protein
MVRTVDDMTTTTDLMPTVEHAELLATLEHHRSFLRHTITGLTREQATATPTPSPLCVGGIVKHVAAQERSWIHFVVEGPSSMAFTPEALEAHAAEFHLLPDETVESVLSDYEAAAAGTAEVMAATPDLGASHPLPDAPWFEPGARWSTPGAVPPHRRDRAARRPRRHHPRSDRRPAHHGLTSVRRGRVQLGASRRQLAWVRTG